MDREHLKIYTKEVSFSQSKIPFILSVIALPFAIYFMIIGYLVDAEALMFGYSSSFIVIFMLCVGISNYLKLKKDIANMFEKSDVIEYEFELIQDEYILYNITTDQKIYFKSQDIAGVFYKKNTIILKLKNRKIVFFPIIDSIRNILSRQQETVDGSVSSA